ncbi:MAG: hypothetical protein GY927_23070 [bacterium]|nr:hypothetical protein [bacterium]
MMELVGQLINSLGMGGLMALGAAIIVLLLALFLLFKPKSRLARRGQNTEIEQLIRAGMSLSQG